MSVSTQAGAGVPLPTRIVLPASGEVPPVAAPAPDGPASRVVDDDGAWLDPFVSPLVQLRDDRDRDAWFHFCHGHHMEFLYWQATTRACDAAVAALGSGDAAGAARWVDRTVTLVNGSAAMLWFCGAFDTEVYDPLLRTSMAAQRDDFSGDMSSDFLRMMTAKSALVEALTGAGEAVTAQRDAFRAAERDWYHQHSDVVLALHPGDSLLKEKLDGLKQRSPEFDYRRYIDTVVHSAQARRDYDTYFGVERVADMSHADYWTQALAKVDVVHHHFRLTDEVRARLLSADALLLALVAEQ